MTKFLNTAITCGPDPLRTPHELFPWEYAMKRKPPPDPRHRSWMPEKLFPQRCA